MADSMQVATGGTHDRDDRCGNCGTPLLAKVDSQERIEFLFCGNFDGECPAVLLEVEP